MESSATTFGDRTQRAALVRRRIHGGRGYEPRRHISSVEGRPQWESVQVEYTRKEEPGSVWIRYTRDWDTRQFAFSVKHMVQNVG